MQDSGTKIPQPFEPIDAGRQSPSDGAGCHPNEAPFAPKEDERRSTPSDENLPVLVLSMYDESLYTERALQAGAQGYVMKQESIAQVVKAPREVLSGGICASNSVKEKAFQRLVSLGKRNSQSPIDYLSDRELEVFRFIGEGLSTREITDQMKLSIKTIGTYSVKIKEKFDLKNYTQLVKMAVCWSDKLQK